MQFAIAVSAKLQANDIGRGVQGGSSAQRRPQLCLAKSRVFRCTCRLRCRRFVVSIQGLFRRRSVRIPTTGWKRKKEEGRG